MINKKYKLLQDDTIHLWNNIDVGGYVETEKNLSHEGDCWIYDNTKVYYSATVGG